MPQAIKLVDAEGRPCIYVPITQFGKVVDKATSSIWRMNKIMRGELPRNTGTDADGVAQCDADHFEKCTVCSQWFDMRDLAQVVEHIHDSEIEVLEGPAPPCDPPVN